MHKCFRGLAAGIYTTNSAEACQYCAQHSKANIIVVEDTKQLEKILQIRKHLVHLKAIIQYEGIPKEKDVLSVRICNSIIYIFNYFKLRITIHFLRYTLFSVG